MYLDNVQPPNIPDDFFSWLKKTSEEHWAHVEINRDIYGFQVQKDTKWLRGLSDEEIAKYEQEMGFSFPDIYKTYLRSCLKIDCQPDQLGMFKLCLTKTILVI